MAVTKQRYTGRLMERIAFTALLFTAFPAPGRQPTCQIIMCVVGGEPAVSVAEVTGFNPVMDIFSNECELFIESHSRNYFRNLINIIISRVSSA
jgi:hypothetical protein